MKVMPRQDALLLIVFLMLLANVSCRARTTEAERKATSAASPSFNNSSPTASSFAGQEAEQNGIRQVDFKNFNYPWYPSYLKPPQGKRQISLRGGKFEIERDEQQGIDNLVLELQDVSYVDLANDGKEEAIVTVGGISIFNKFVDSIFIYAFERNVPLLLWNHETGDRADGGLRRISVQNGMLSVEQYVRSEGDGGLCCPTKFVRTDYTWNGNRFEKIKSETLPNDHKNAEFLGYPSNQRAGAG